MLDYHSLCCLGRLRQGKQRQFQLDALVTAPGHMLQGCAQCADSPDRRPLPQFGALLQIAGFFLRRNAGKQAFAAGQRCQHQRTVVRDQFFGQTFYVHRLLPQPGQQCQSRCSILCFQRIGQLEQIAPVGNARHAAHNVRIDLGRDTGTGIQDRQGVPQRTIRQAGDQLSALLGQLQLFLSGDILHPGRNILRADAGKIIPLTTGEDGGRDLLDLGSSQDKDNVGGGFLQGLEQRIERCCGQHVHLVDDVHLVLTGRRGVGGLVPQVADIVHAVVGGRVHLHYIQNTAIVQALADLTLPAGVSVLGMQAVDCLCKDLGTGGLAGAPHSGKQVCVSHPPGSDLVLQRRHNGTLTHYILKAAGPPFAVQRTIHRLSPPFL